MENQELKKCLLKHDILTSLEIAMKKFNIDDLSGTDKKGNKIDINQVFAFISEKAQTIQSSNKKLALKHLKDFNDTEALGRYWQTRLKPLGIHCSLFSEGLAVVFIKDDHKIKYGFINQDGEVVVELKYQEALSFNEGLAAVQENGKWGFIDNKGAVIIKPEYDYVECFKNGQVTVKKYGNIMEALKENPNKAVPLNYGDKVYIINNPLLKRVIF